MEYPTNKSVHNNKDNKEFEKFPIFEYVFFYPVHNRR